MRTANDGRGDEAWGDPDPALPIAADDDSTRVMSRGELSLSVPEPPAPAPDRALSPGGAVGAGDADATAVFTREPPTGPFGPAHGTGAADTREFARDGEGTATREFSRDTLPPGPRAEPAAGAPGGPHTFTRRFVRDRPGGRSPARPGSPPTGRGTEPPTPPEPAVPAGREHRPAPRPRRRRRLRLRWIITAVLLTVLALPPATWGWVWYTARQDDRSTTDAIVVLGASQYNGIPSPVFEARLRHAQVLYLDGVAPMIVTVGGKMPGDNYTEAAAGRNWLIEVGIPADRVIAVEEGSDTLQSIRAVSAVFSDSGWEEATLVSDPWHSLRSKVIASDHGIESGTSPSRSGPAVIERRTQLWYITRETASLWYYWIFNDSSDIRVNAA